MHVVVGTSSVVAVIVDGGVWLLGSIVWSEQTGRKGEKGEQSNREYSSKVLASKELHYICNVLVSNGKRGNICGLNCRMPE